MINTSQYHWLTLHNPKSKSSPGATNGYDFFSDQTETFVSCEISQENRNGRVVYFLVTWKPFLCALSCTKRGVSSENEVSNRRKSEKFKLSFGILFLG
jgi:hypothetical protein